MKKEKPKCKNCGDPTSFGTTVPEREKFGWCVPCYTQWKKYRRVTDSGSEYWVDDGRPKRNPYGSKLTTRNSDGNHGLL